MVDCRSCGSDNATCTRVSSQYACRYVFANARNGLIFEIFAGTGARLDAITLGGIAHRRAALVSCDWVALCAVCVFCFGDYLNANGARHIGVLYFMHILIYASLYTIHAQAKHPIPRESSACGRPTNGKIINHQLRSNRHTHISDTSTHSRWGWPRRRSGLTEAPWRTGGHSTPGTTLTHRPLLFFCVPQRI